MFKKYNSIENSYREELLEHIKGHGYWDNEYVVQEKAHGSNLSFRTRDGVNYIAAKRTADITANEKFFHFNIVLESLQSNFNRIWDKIKNQYPDVEQLTIFGEIIGGSYPYPKGTLHADVARHNGAVKVQKGIYYSPNNHFYAFDMLLNNEQYLDVHEANQYFETEKLLHAKTLFQGRLDACLNYSNAFNSTIPNDLGLPELMHNLCEGVVIRPVKTVYFNSGSRVILKNKNDKWAENVKFHASIKQEEEISEKVIKLQQAIQTYITQNRLNNVISKIGEISIKDYGRVLGSFNKDIVESFFNDYHKFTDNLDRKELKSITKSISREANNLVRENIIN